MLTALMLKQAYAHGAASALREVGYPLQTAHNISVKLAEEAMSASPQPVMPQEMQPEMQPGMQTEEVQPERHLLGPNPGMQEQQESPDVGSLVESGGLGVPQSPEMQGQEAPPEAYADANNDDIYGALSE